MKYLSSTIIFVHNFTLKITSARLNKGLVVSLVEKNKGPGYKTSKYGIQRQVLKILCSLYFQIQYFQFHNTIKTPSLFRYSTINHEFYNKI